MSRAPVPNGANSDSLLTTPSSKSPNPLLCNSCQPWKTLVDGANDINILYCDGRDVEESRKKSCLVREAVKKAINLELKLDTGSNPSSVISVINSGPFFPQRFLLEDSFNSPRIEQFSNGELGIRLAMDIQICRTESSGDTKDVRLTPRFLFRYSNMTDVVMLVNIELWETPYFDVSIIKTWVQGCEALHEKCTYKDEAPCKPCLGA